MLLIVVLILERPREILSEHEKTEADYANDEAESLPNDHFAM